MVGEKKGAKLLLSLSAVALAAMYLMPNGSERFVEAEAQRRKASAGMVHIEYPPPERYFPFHAASDGCVPRSEVENLSASVRKLLNANVRVFPRHGFLLGIVRHGGFLPHEHVDADLGVVSEDLERPEGLEDYKSNPMKEDSFQAAGFGFRLKPTEPYWKRWFGTNPVTREPYPFLGVNINIKDVITLHANSVYPYRDTGKYFYPWLTNNNNHRARVVDHLRYNDEGGDWRIMDTDERLDASNSLGEAQQWGNFFDTDLTCFVEKQFYHTTIPVPCDYDTILTSLYGRNWGRVESRGDIGLDDGGEVEEEGIQVSDEANNAVLWGGPKPICMD